MNLSRYGLIAGVGAVAALAALGAEPDDADAPVLSPITILADAMAPHWLVGQADSVAAALAASPAVLLNSQGGSAVQSDLIIRGSSFSGAGLALDGLPLRNPQTEHFHAELPVPAAWLSGPRVLTGLDQALAADGYLVGTVSLGLRPVMERLRLGAGGGERDRRWVDVQVSRPWAPDAGAGRPDGGWQVFGASESVNAVDYPDNDFERDQVAGHVQWLADDLQADVVVSHQAKTFGARGYYGVSEALAAEEEIADTLVFATVRRVGADANHVRLSGAWRELVDDYAILPDIFVNHTRSKVLSAFADGRQGLRDDVDVTWRIGVEDESLSGLTLGEQSRERGVAMIAPAWTIGRALRLTAGTRAEVFSGDEPAVLPLAGLEVRLVEGVSVYVAYTETVRQPSFTELNYESPGSLGDAGLDRQEARALEGGLRGSAAGGVEWRAAVFQRRGRETVDWVRPTAESVRFEATNIGDVDTLGVEGALAATILGRLALNAQYTWLDKDDEVDVHASRYVLDYAEHLVKVSAVLRLTESLDLVGTQVLRWQRENPLRRSDDFGATGSFALHAAVPGVEALELTLAVENAWDDDFEVYAGQRTGGRRVTCGATLAW